MAHCVKGEGACKQWFNRNDWREFDWLTYLIESTRDYKKAWEAKSGE